MVAPMTQPPEVNVIEGRVVHKKSNALQITFHDAAGEPFAVGIQGANDKAGKKLGILFGFKNGGVGNHRLSYSDGRTLGVASKDGAPRLFTQEGGAEIATVQRGPTSVAVSRGGQVFTFVGDPDEAKTLELFRLRLTDAVGEDVGRLDVIRRVGGWSLSRALDAAITEYIWWDMAGRALPVPILGTRLTLNRQLTEIERDVLLAACVDMAIGLRPYATAMQ
jgi:hypothetical protein